MTARVPGAVERVRFSEGQKVGTGAVLVEIEPQRYKLAVEAARAALEKTKAAEADAQAGVDRREKAVAATPGLIPGEEIESWRTRQRTAAADVAEKKAALAQAELNLRDAYVRAPVAGLIETRRVQTGQYVQPGTVLATLVRREPLLLRFSVPGARGGLAADRAEGPLHPARAGPELRGAHHPRGRGRRHHLAHGGDHGRGAGQRQGEPAARGLRRGGDPGGVAAGGADPAPDRRCGRPSAGSWPSWWRTTSPASAS